MYLSLFSMLVSSGCGEGGPGNRPGAEYMTEAAAILFAYRIL